MLKYTIEIEEGCTDCSRCPFHVPCGDDINCVLEHLCDGLDCSTHDLSTIKINRI